MLKTVVKGRPTEALPRRVLARVVAEDLRCVQGGGTAQSLSIIQTGSQTRDQSETDSEHM